MIERTESDAPRPKGWSFPLIGMALYSLPFFFFPDRGSADIVLAGTASAGLVFAYLAYRRRYEGAAWSDFGLVPLKADDLVTGLLCGGVSWSAAYLCFRLGLASSGLQTNMKWAGVSGPLAPAALAWMVATIVFAEECLFRAYLIPRLEARMGTLTAVLVSSLLFGVAHMDNVATLALCGGIFGAAFLRRRSLWASFIAHLFHNAIVLVAVYPGAQRAIR